MDNLHTTRSKLLSYDDGVAVLSPHFENIVAGISEGWERWTKFEKESPRMRAPLSTRTRAGFVHDHIIDSVKGLFEPHLGRGVRILEENGFPVFEFDGKILLRFKKLDYNARPRNIITDQQYEWKYQQFELTGVDCATVVTAGYQLNILGTEIKDIRIVCLYGEEAIWGFSVYDEIKKPEGITLFPASAKPLPSAATVPHEEVPLTVRVRPINVAKEGS